MFFMMKRKKAFIEYKDKVFGVLKKVANYISNLSPVSKVSIVFVVVLIFVSLLYQSKINNMQKKMDLFWYYHVWNINREFFEDDFWYNSDSLFEDIRKDFEKMRKYQIRLIDKYDNIFVDLDKYFYDKEFETNQFYKKYEYNNGKTFGYSIEYSWDHLNWLVESINKDVLLEFINRFKNLWLSVYSIKDNSFNFKWKLNNIQSILSILNS